MNISTFSLELRPNIPEKLQRIEELANNLAYSWDREIRDVFWRLDRVLWKACGMNPKLFLRRIAQSTLDQAAADRDFMEDYNRALSSFDVYMGAPPRPEIQAHLPGASQVAYFCAEFGLHESLPIYSGGLGILAGDHCKAASDLRVPFIAVGLLYRQGYFTQLIDAAGNQQVKTQASDFDELPILPCLDEQGAEIRIAVEIADRMVALRLWHVVIGHVRLILLDADLAENADNRSLTHQLYGGDSDTRIRQEMLLGIGGVRALRALGHKPSVFHMNEGHAAFLILERLREYIEGGMDFETALELTAAGNVFTTHTPVPAGHDVFNFAQLRFFLGPMLKQLRCEETRVLELGALAPAGQMFNMTTLALRGSRFHNGVSKIHGGVASRMEQSLWPQASPEENPISSITNGVHLPTFIARGWLQLFHDLFRGWRSHLLEPQFWQAIDTIPYERFVSVRQEHKRELLLDISQRLCTQLRRNGVPQALIARAVLHVSDENSKSLVMGFARRFASYKRATLILTDEARLARILNNPERPALLIFAGKAHPKDHAGQALIKKIHQTSMRPEFIGRLILVEGYDMLLARNLVQGCDVWLNNPEYPLEASGTSGEKAGINGAVNVSVLDGWWNEAYDGSNGFVVSPVDPRYWQMDHPVDEESARRLRDEEEGKQLLDIIEQQVAPQYYGARNEAYAPGWVQLSKNSMKTLIPQYNSARMVMDYVRQSYGPAARQAQRLQADDAALARSLAAWKQKIRARWSGVRLELTSAPARVLQQGQQLQINVDVHLNGLTPDDVAIECVIGETPAQVLPLQFVSGDEGAARFTVDMQPLPGMQHYSVRMRPVHAGQSHAFELGCQVWASAPVSFRA